MFKLVDEDFVVVFGHRLAMRCTARSKRSGERCCGYAVHNFSVCRMHGAGGGPKTAEGLIRLANTKLVHGRETRHLRLARKALSERLRYVIALGNSIGLFEDRKLKS